MNFRFDWPTAHGFDRPAASFKLTPEDFRVVEQLPMQTSGDGEHLWLTLRKTGQNTEWLARQLAKWAGVKSRDIGYAGLKDRHAVTEQTFSVHLPGKASPSLDTLVLPGTEIIAADRHHQKLRTGQLVGNHFVIRLKHLPQNSFDYITACWQQVVEHGVPNYFGDQRFGHEGNNVIRGVECLIGQARLPRQHRSIYLSAVRSYLFNHLLSERVTQSSWNKLLNHDFVQFTEGKTGFYCVAPEPMDIDRVSQGKASPCASLPGVSHDDFPELENREAKVLAEYQAIVSGLVDQGVKRQFRKLRTYPERSSIEFIESDVVVKFFLPAGSYATVVLSEVFDLSTGQSRVAA